MKKTITIIIAFIVLLAVYKKQHIQPVDDPKDTPIFQQRLKSSLDRFQDVGLPARQDRVRERARPGKSPSPYSRAPDGARDLMVSGRCGRVNLTWVEKEKIEKGKINIKRRAKGEEYAPLKDKRIYERAEEGGIRYWASESGLSDGVRYEYLISFKDAQGKEVVKGPVSVNLTCTEGDREIVAQREKAIKEYYQKKGIKPEDYAARRTSPVPSLPPRSRDLMVSGRCSRVTLTWVEKEKIEKGKINIKRRAQGEEYAPLKDKRIYERAEEGGGIRYWTSDSGLTDDLMYEYLVSFKDEQGKETTKGPVSINLTCNERDREIIAQREKLIKEYYQKRGIEVKDYGSLKPPTYQLSKEIYKIDPGNSPQKGRKDAPISLVVFTDFECVHCSTWAETLDAMLKNFPRDTKIIFKNYPIPYHTQAELAAMAALAAGEQGKFWEMHDLLFKNQKALGKENILGYAKALALNLPKFRESLESKELKKLIYQDKAQGKTLGVQNIPTTFINGRSLMGSPPPSYIKGIIEDILKKH